MNQNTQETPIEGYWRNRRSEQVRELEAYTRGAETSAQMLQDAINRGDEQVALLALRGLMTAQKHLQDTFNSNHHAVASIKMVSGEETK